MKRLRYVLLGLLLAAAVLPIITVLALRWIDPPVSAFMLRSHWSANADGPSIYYLWADMDRISPDLALAAVAAEDQTFPRHGGFVWSQIRKVVTQGQARGASSITQQTAKNLFLWPGRSYIRKGIEAYLTFWMELLWPKARILEMYLNVAQFGDHIYGAEAAARRLFGTRADALSAEQAALMAAVLPNPLRYNASRPGPYVRERQAWILQQMRQLGHGHLAAILK
ncbi:MAG: monofunctional biosynthetic peptidoglycan transglycosylase [Salinisphaeraceae bacterium]|nr:monofunctional biosynthetic peptidoglycan transglycosylase [Salinisphaeraceae bacterium]